jgi:hypothetical protein
VNGIMENNTILFKVEDAGLKNKSPIVENAIACK